MCSIIKMSSDILVEYSRDELILMLNILKNKLPQKIRQYNYLYSYLYHYDTINANRHQIYSGRWNVRFYGPRYGNIQNCTIITINGRQDYGITVFTLEESRAELKECLQRTRLINWQNDNLNIMCDESLFKTVNGFICEMGIDWINLPLENILYITKEKINELTFDKSCFSEDLYVAPLEAEKHAEIINDHWDYKHENSLELIQHSIKMNGGTGLFLKHEEQPISWMTTNEFLTPGFLYTREPYRKKGYGNLVMTLELKRLVKLFNTDIFSFVVMKNEPSLRLHYKLGFKCVNNVTLIEKPRN